MFVFGASGHAKVVIDAIERGAQHRVSFLCDDAPERCEAPLMGYPVLRGREELLKRRAEAGAGIVTIGDNHARAKVGEWLVEHGFELISVIHPGAQIGRDVAVGPGTVVMAGCVINSGSRLGRNVIVNTGATIDHDCAIEDGAHIAPGCHLCGHVSVGSGTLLGAGTAVIPSVRIGAKVVVGAGSTVLEDIADGARVAGSPCRPIPL